MQRGPAIPPRAAAGPPATTTPTIQRGTRQSSCVGALAESGTAEANHTPGNPRAPVVAPVTRTVASRTVSSFRTVPQSQAPASRLSGHRRTARTGAVAPVG